MKHVIATVAVLVVMSSSMIAFGADAAPQKVNYQGILKDSNGDPVTTCVSMTFSIYDAAVGGAMLWQETHTNVCPDEGGFNVILGNGDVPVALSDDIFNASERWLGVTVGADPEMSPRTQMVTAPYSQRVSTVDRASAGIISGALEIETESAKDWDAADASLLVRGDFGDSVMIAPSANRALYATDQNGDVALSANVDNQGGAVQIYANAAGAYAAVSPRYVLIQPGNNVAFRATSDNGDDLISMTTANTGGAIAVSASDAAKSLTRTVEIAPAQGVALRATETNGDETVAITSASDGAQILVTASDAAKALTRSVTIAPAQNTALKVTEQNGDDVLLLSSDQNGAAIEVNSSDAAKGLSRSVRIAPALGEALKVTEQNGDDVLLLSSNANGGAIEINTSDAAKADPNAITSKVMLAPGSGSILKAIDNGGNTLVELKEEGGAGKIVLSTASTKAIQKQVEITEDGIVFWNNTLTDTNMIISAQGSIVGKGKLAMGAENVNAGNWANVLGYDNDASGDSSTIAGGYSNTASGFVSFIGGGRFNVASSDLTVVAGGNLNTASGSRSAVGGGENNVASGYMAVIAGGTENTASNTRDAIGGGYQNATAGGYSNVSGGLQNTADGQWATVGGGGFNTASGAKAVVSGGSQNRAYGAYSVVAGGGGASVVDSNSASGDYSTIGGGRTQYTTGDYSTIGGGAFNKARGDYAVVSGGGGSGGAVDSNSAHGFASVIGGGRRNFADGAVATIAGGHDNETGANYASVLGGAVNKALGGYSVVGGGHYNIAEGSSSVVPGGRQCSAVGTQSLAAGSYAKAMHNGSFVLSANNTSATSDSIASGGVEQFVVRADSGLYFTNSSGVAPYNTARLINTSTGACLTTGGTWTDASDRNLKENVHEIDGRELLDKLRDLPVTEWNYIAEEDNVKRIGPMGQDFYRIFGYGGDEKSLSARDLASIAVVAIQALDRKTSEIDDLKQKMAEMESLINKLLKDRQ